MKTIIIFSGSIKHDEKGEWTDYLCLKNSEKDETQGATIKRLLIYPNGVKLGRAAATASVSDAGVSFEIYAKRLDSPSKAIRIGSATLPVNAPKKAFEVKILADFPTDTVVIKGEYTAISFKIDADTSGKEVQFEQVEGEHPDLELIVEDEEMTEVNDESTTEVSDTSTIKKEDDGDVTMKKEEDDGEEKGDNEELDTSHHLLIDEEEVEEDEEKKEEEGEEVEEDGGRSSVQSEAVTTVTVELTEEERKALEKQKAEEKRLRREKEDREAMELEADDDFSVEKFEPVKITTRRPPWKERAVGADTKAWELFCDAVTTFDTDTLDIYLEDWAVTVENLLPSLRNCLRETTTKGIPVGEEGESVNDLPQLMVDWARFGLCLDRADAQPSPAKFLRVGLGIVEQIAGFSYAPRYASMLLEQGIAWDLMNVITETTYSALQHDAMQALNLLQCCRGVSLTAAMTFFRYEKAASGHVEEGTGKESNGGDEMNKNEDEEASIYDRMALLIAQSDETGEPTILLDLTLRVIARSNLNAAAARLTTVCHDLSSASNAEEEKRLREEMGVAVEVFIDRFGKNDEVLRRAGLDDEALKAYSILADCDWTSVLCVLLSHPHDSSLTKAIRFTIRIMDAQECVGLFAMAESSSSLQRLLIKQLLITDDDHNDENKKKYEETAESSSSSSSFIFDETPQLNERMRGREVAERLAYRWYTLQLVDQLADANRGLSVETIDAHNRVDILHKMLRLIVSDKGEDALGFVLSECAYSQLISIVLLSAEEKRHASTVRGSISYAYAVELVKAVSQKATKARFWLRNARHYQKIHKFGCISPMSSFHTWWEPFNDGAISGADLGSHSTVTAMKNKLRHISDKHKEGDPPIPALSIVRVLSDLLTDPRRSATPRTRAARYETILFCLSDGIDKIIESILKISLEYRMSLWSIGTSIETAESEIFRDFALRSLKILGVLFGESMKQSKSVKSVSVNAVGYAAGLWTLTTGLNKALPSLGEQGREIRRAVLSFLRVMCALDGDVEKDSQNKSAFTRVVRRIFDFAKDRMYCQPAALTLLSHMADWPKTTEEYGEAVKESANPIAIMLLNYAPYGRQMAEIVFNRLEKSLDADSFAVLVKSIYTQIIFAFTTRPRRSLDIIDKEDIAVSHASDRHVHAIKMLARMMRSRRFVVTLLDKLHDDPQANARLQYLLTVLTTPNIKYVTHTEFQVIFSDIIATLADHDLYKEQAEAVVDDVPAAEVSEKNEGGDEFLDADDRDCVTLDEDVEEVAEPPEETDEDKEKKMDIPFRITRALVRLVCGSSFNPCASLAAIRALERVHSTKSDLANDTVVRAWWDLQQRHPTVRMLVNLLAVNKENDEVNKEIVKDLVQSVATHLEAVFGDGKERHLYEVLDLEDEGEVEIEEGSEVHKLRPTAVVVKEIVTEDDGEIWDTIIARAKTADEDENATMTPRVKVVIDRESIDHEHEAAANYDLPPLSLIISVPESEYEDKEIDQSTREDIEKYTKRGRGIEGHLRISERVEGVVVRRPLIPREVLLKKEGTDETKTEKKEEKDKSSSDDKPTVPKVLARVAAIKKKPVEKKEEEGVPNRIQPAVIPSRPAKRTAPTSVPRAGIKRRR